MTDALKLRPYMGSVFIKVQGESQKPDDFQNFKTSQFSRDPPCAYIMTN
jgi:hypothetical protein